MSDSLPPSIFNDVLGPVMRGPSSSHSAASVRIARTARALAGGRVDKVLLEMDPNGSLPTTFESQGSAIGIYGGLQGWEADDSRIPDSKRHLEEAGIDLTIEVRDIGAKHPNTYQLTVTNDETGTTHKLIADSVGGGMIVVHHIDGQAVRWFGDKTLYVTGYEDGSVECSEVAPPTGGAWTRTLDPVLPVATPDRLELPFRGSKELLAWGDGDSLPLSHFALAYETARSGTDEAAVLDLMKYIRDIMRGSIDAGLAGTEYQDRVLGAQSPGFRKAMDNGTLLEGGMLNRMILYITALMEAKSAMEVIVAAPTAGSCGTFPGACLAAADELDLSEDQILRGMVSGGLIGVIFAIRSSFAAEVGGCQAETGAGSAMVAATLVEWMGGNARQSLDAASLALQNVLGLVCDPVANRVEAPCLGRNVAGASNALASANMVLAGYDALIPFDEVLDAHKEISRMMPRELRCTALGGLSVTPTSKAIEAKLCGGCSSCG